MSWPILLAPERAAHARARAEELGHAIVRDERDVDASLHGGRAGHAVLFAQLGAATGDAAWFGHARTCLDDALDQASALAIPGLAWGLAGVVWAAEHLQQRHGAAIELGDEPIGDEVIDQLADAFAPASWPAAAADLMVGLTGVGILAVTRLRRGDEHAGAQRLLAHVLDGLEAHAAAAHHIPPALLSGSRLAEDADGCQDLGMAHGVAGAVALLARVTGPLAARAHALLDREVTWLLAQRRADAVPWFPTTISPHDGPRFGRSAWCYGDHGVASALLAAGRARRRDDWCAVAVDTMRADAARARPATSAENAALCHGAAGRAHVHHRIAVDAGEPALADEARRWIDVTLAMPAPDDLGLLEGTAGIALALLAAATPHAPDWDFALGLGVP